MGADHEEIDERAALWCAKDDTKARLARAKLVVAAARDRAVETAQQRRAPSMKRFPTVLQRRRLTERLAQYGGQF